MEDNNETGVMSETLPENINTAGGDFNVPDAYKGQGWTQNIKSYDDLWQNAANAQKLIGKKTIGIPDENSTDEQWQEYYSKLRPANEDDYTFELDDADDVKALKKIFYENGVTQKQAAAIIDGYKKSEEKMTAQYFSKDGYNKEMAERFGDKAPEVCKAVGDFIKKEVSEKDRAALEVMPNNVIGVVTSVINTVQKRYAIKDTDTGINGPKGAPKDPDYVGYAKAAVELSHRPHDMKDLNELKSQFNIPMTKGK